MSRAAKCVILDFGNVVAFFDHQRACQQLAELSRIKLSEDRVLSICEEIFDTTDLETRYDSGKISTQDFIKELRRLFDIPADVPPRKIADAWNDIFAPNEPVIKLIPRLKIMPYKLILASNTNELHYGWFKVIFKDVLAYFDAEVLSYHQEVGCQKPCGKFYEQCLKVAGFKASQCIFVDDKEKNVNGACDFGMKGIKFTTVDHLYMKLNEYGVPIVQPM